jgi:hypothetical protein
MRPVQFALCLTHLYAVAQLDDAKIIGKPGMLYIQTPSKATTLRFKFLKVIFLRKKLSFPLVRALVLPMARIVQILNFVHRIQLPYVVLEKYGI